MLRAAPGTSSLGRRARGSLTPPIGREYGNNLPALSGDVRAPDQRNARTFGDNDYGDFGYTSFRGLRHPREQTPGPWYSPGGPGSAYGGGWSDGVLTVRDRHVMTRRGHTRWGSYEDNSGIPNPEHDGPPMPEYQMVDTTESWQLGTDGTANMDNTGEHNFVEVTGRPGKRFPLGQQDGTETLVVGPPLGEWREYGARGPKGMHGPPPDEFDPNVRGKPRLVQAGAPGMQPADYRVVYGGVPHGLHSPTASSTLWPGARFASTPQMQAPRVDRPASSKVAGQSMSQQFPPEASFGQQRATPRMADSGRRAGLGARFLGRS
jgi:hypothetical protein